ncbi:unnamed protein product, partial [Mesorhabditis spiculigera]
MNDILTRRPYTRRSAFEGMVPRQKKEWAFVVINFCYWALGFTSVILSMWIMRERDQFVELIPIGFAPNSCAGFLLCSGLVIMALAIMAIYANYLKSKRMMASYCLGIGFLVLIQIAIGTISTFTRDDSKLRDDMKRYINLTRITTINSEAINVTLSWNYLQKSLHCCGIDGYEDWYYNARWPTGQFVPDSCCDESFFDFRESDYRGCGRLAFQDYVYKNGCLEPFRSWLWFNQHVVAGFCLFALIVEIFCLPLGIWICREVWVMKDWQQRQGSRVGNARSISETVAGGQEPRIDDSGIPLVQPPTHPTR